MDFASLMSAQISKSKSPANAEGPKKYLKRADLEAQRLADYEAEQDRQDQERLARLEKKRKADEEEADRAMAREEKRRKFAEESRRLREEEELAEERKRRKRLGLPDLPDKTLDASADGAPIPENEDVIDEELHAKLREMDHPAILFGETHADRLRRYKRLTSKALAPVRSKGPIPTTLELVPEAEMKIPDLIPKDHEGLKLLYRQMASYFTMILSEWQRDMTKRDEETKQSSSGKAAYSSMIQARDDLVPLFRKFEKGSVETSVLEAIVTIVRSCQQRRYVDANDAYLKLSIGKQAYPLGVIAIGIHERAARQRLHEGSGDKAHIMSDETTRKSLQSIKRCLTYAQTRWPPDDHLQLMG
ncbi:Pre-mRNA-splicing factor 18 [Sphaceloma murrayae]|uniref:Pre-mRNA-splicing factor 18 n=1 Tax=Sphaceloma murrayae TaxID=2082308 RepID=A0A2K1QJ54_9PEZI|nr:Pre-mRNA-splicing factor 18 [Sphaceloma murrayae]